MTSIKENVEEVASAIGVAAAVLAVDVECPNDFRYIKPAGRRLSRLQNQLEQARTAGSFHTRQTQTVSLDEKKALLNNQPKKVGQSMFSKGYSSVDAMSASTIFTRRNKRTKRLRKLTDKMESSLRQDLQLRPKVHELLPLPVLRKFDVEQAEIAYRRRARPKVLIVDGNLIHLAACKHIFEKRFEVVQCVKSADQALDLVDHIVFDVILVALDLPGDLSGLDLVDALRHVEQQSKFAFRTLVLAMLTKEQEKDRTVLDACFCSGMDRFLMKPAVHTVHTIADLLTSGDSLDTFRRLTLETHWISNHGGMIDLLQGDIAKAKAIQAIVEEERTEEKLQREAEAMMDDQGQQHAVKKLHDRQQIEDLNRIISATTQLRRQNEELRHRITELEEEKARNTAVENRNVDALVVLEKRVVAAEREIHEKNRESEHLRLEAEHHRADLKNLLDNGCINAQMVKQAKQRVASFQRRMEANEKLAMESHDTMCKRMWFNYYGNAGNRGRADVGQFVPRFAVDTAATWYRTELNQLISVVGNVMQDSANVIDQSRLTLSRFVDIEFPEVDAVCNVARDQMQLVTKRTTSDLNKLRNAVEDCVAAVLVREISFWKFFEDEERSLREELRSIKAYIADKQQKLIDASASTQTNTPTWDVFLPTFDGMFRKTVEGISEKLDSDSCPPEIMEPISQFYHRLPSHIQRCANTSAVARCLLTLTPLLFDEQVYSVRVRTSAFYAVMERIIELEEQAAYARRRSPSTRLSSMEDLTDGRRVELDPASDSDHLGLEGESNMITGGTSGVFVHSTPLGEPTPETKPLVRRRSRKSVVSTADDSKEKQNDSKDGKGSRKSSTTTGGPRKSVVESMKQAASKILTAGTKKKDRSQSTVQGGSVAQSDASADGRIVVIPNELRRLDSHNITSIQAAVAAHSESIASHNAESLCEVGALQSALGALSTLSKQVEEMRAQQQDALREKEEHVTELRAFRETLQKLSNENDARRTAASVAAAEAQRKIDELAASQKRLTGTNDALQYRLQDATEKNKNLTNEVMLLREALRMIQANEVQLTPMDRSQLGSQSGNDVSSALSGSGEHAAAAALSVTLVPAAVRSLTSPLGSVSHDVDQQEGAAGGSVVTGVITPAGRTSLLSPAVVSPTANAFSVAHPSSEEEVLLPVLPSSVTSASTPSLPPKPLPPPANDKKGGVRSRKDRQKPQLDSFLPTVPISAATTAASAIVQHNLPASKVHQAQGVVVPHQQQQQQVQHHRTSNTSSEIVTKNNNNNNNATFNNVSTFAPFSMAGNRSMPPATHHPVASPRPGEAGFNLSPVVQHIAIPSHAHSSSSPTEPLPHVLHQNVISLSLTNDPTITQVPLSSTSRSQPSNNAKKTAASKAFLQQIFRDHPAPPAANLPVILSASKEPLNVSPPKPRRFSFRLNQPTLYRHTSRTTSPETPGESTVPVAATARRLVSPHEVQRKDYSATIAITSVQPPPRPTELLFAGPRRSRHEVLAALLDT